MAYESEGRNSVTFRMSDGLKKEAEDEMKILGRHATFSEFLNDAVKNYIEYLRDQRYRKHEYESVRTINGPDS